MKRYIHKIRQFFAQIFCKHNYEWCAKRSLYHSISGETQYLACRKCGKIKDERFIRYD